MTKLKEIFSYLFFGFLTTLISILTFGLFNAALGEKLYLISNIFSWVISVAFAFVTNKIYVFRSLEWNVKILRTELFGFVGARIFSLVLEEAGLFLLMDIIKFNSFETRVLSFSITGGFISKIIMQIVVVITNYFFSKFIIFKKSN
jgi:putative flippase GtrA